MPRQLRLTRADFLQLKDVRPKIYHGRFFSLAVFATNACTKPKTACVVAKKNISRSVDRTALKRRVREIVRNYSPLPHEVFVIYAKKQAHMTSFEDMRDDLSELIGRIR